ncbi:hypothetical protein Kfla_2827 [Kribbella flavida DSM 17836]|uniref:Uncharacterized protein n=1 Tax=Kribbella flavida (strain DSM 17836 / JCM 10339 / NBRC 14399) TaxID=479435 RepID=D2Q0A0_KRIFD|nr:hypothetical protein [Kribbella flavida]ADB31892.1 hypothetical protein Kfla_2827 [Kribbella flavida DSM 17836]
MRDNGLTAATYTSMGGIDPLVTAPVLTALADAGIAAYSTVPGGSVGAPPADAADEEAGSAAGSAPASDAARTDAGPQTTAPVPADDPARRLPAGFEEIFVDSAAVQRARAVIDRSTEDAEWKSLVEQFNAPSAPGHDAPPVPRWPASEDVDEKYEPLIDVPAGISAEDTEPKPAEERPARRADDPHDHFIPPEPPRGPRLDWISRAAWLGLIGGPLLLILAAVLDFGTGRLTLLAVVGFMAGFLTLVIRMNDRLPPEDTPDDGAVV